MHIVVIQILLIMKKCKIIVNCKPTATQLFAEVAQTQALYFLGLNQQHTTDAQLHFLTNRSCTLSWEINKNVNGCMAGIQKNQAICLEYLKIERCELGPQKVQFCHFPESLYTFVKPQDSPKLINSYNWNKKQI